MVKADAVLAAVPERRKSFVVKILTSKSYGLKILQTIFVKPAPVKGFEACREGGYPQFDKPRT